MSHAGSHVLLLGEDGTKGNSEFFLREFLIKKHRRISIEAVIQDENLKNKVLRCYLSLVFYNLWIAKCGSDYYVQTQ
jgi:hypothetical protein